ncbi:MAG TPA: helix-turn-helix domain-containing protein [Candidatus Limnocylindrales bacterium]|nr:helix-turn-helix domain-containing protein [Candidatus Limnocylindrales bacterium]
MPAFAADPTIRRQVMSAAREVLAEDAAAPIVAIARRAGVSRATFYRHFGSRTSLLRSVEVEPQPAAEARILATAKDMLIRHSLDELSMEELAAAAGVSRGTLYRLIPGKVALLRRLIEVYSPFESIRTIVLQHRHDPPEVVFPLIGRAIVGVAGERQGLMRAIFHEVTGGTEPAIASMHPVFAATLGVLAEYLEEQIAQGRIRRMHPILALQALIGPVFFHLMTRPALDRIIDLPMEPEPAVEHLVATALAGLRA